jgi:hypothetical protein
MAGRLAGSIGVRCGVGWNPVMGIVSVGRPGGGGRQIARLLHCDVYGCRNSRILHDAHELRTGYRSGCSTLISRGFRTWGMPFVQRSVADTRSPKEYFIKSTA